MIKAILAKGFKGLEFRQPLGQYNLFIGPNGVGKSARPQALTLSILGYLPSDGKKQATDIFKIHSHNGEPFTVGFVYSPPGITLESTFSRTFKDGTQIVACNGKKLKQTEIEKILYQHGDPRIFDLAEFIGMSDQKKIDFIFSLFPPEGDLGKIDEELEKIKNQESALKDKRTAKEILIKDLTKEKSEISIPAGTLAEVQKEISDKEQSRDEAQALLNEKEAQEREEKAKADAEARAKKREEDNKKQAEKEKKEAIEAAESKGREEGKAEAKIEAQATTGKAEPTKINTNPDGFVPAHGDFIQVNSGACRGDLERVLSIMEKTGCSSCAAIIVIKTLIGKYQGKEAA